MTEPDIERETKRMAFLNDETFAEWSFRTYCERNIPLSLWTGIPDIPYRDARDAARNEAARVRIIAEMRRAA